MSGLCLLLSGRTWEGGIREPGLVWWPGVVAPQLRFEVASTLDVFATVADAAKLPLPRGRCEQPLSSCTVHNPFIHAHCTHTP